MSLVNCNVCLCIFFVLKRISFTNISPSLTEKSNIWKVLFYISLLFCLKTFLIAVAKMFEKEQFFQLHALKFLLVWPGGLLSSRGLLFVIIQHIVTLPKYGQKTLDVRRST